MNIEVSIIVPIYNRFSEANRAIQSVILQTFKNWELIIIDDCSFIPYKLPIYNFEIEGRIVLLRNEQNLGPGLTRQRGLDIAKGEFICFLDSDDFFDSKFIEYSLKKHKSNVDIAATYTIAKYIQTGEIRKGSNEEYNSIMPYLFSKNRPWPTCSLLWNKKYITKWTNIRTNQDSMFELQCSFINNSICHIPEVLCFIDKGTGENTADLVKACSSDLDRNRVVNFALMNYKNYNLNSQDIILIKKAIITRMLFVSSKIAGHGEAFKILINGVKLMNHDFKRGLFLIFISIPIFIPFKPLRLFCKGIIVKIK